MKTKTIFLLLPIMFGFAAVATYVALGNAGVDTGGSTRKPALNAATSAETESSAPINVNALAAKLQFLGVKPELTGRPLLIEFWATWCPPCRASIAHLNELNKEYHGRGLDIVGISDEDKTTVEDFRARTPMHYSVALDTDQKLSVAFQVQAIPQAWLFDKDGRLIWSGHPMELDEQTILHVLPVHSAT